MDLSSCFFFSLSWRICFDSVSEDFYTECFRMWDAGLGFPGVITWVVRSTPLDLLLSWVRADIIWRWTSPGWFWMSLLKMEALER